MDIKNNNLASLDKRLIGQFLDGLITYAVFFLVYYSFAGILDDITTIYMSIGFSLSYFLFSDSLPGGQSLGKIITKTKVIKKGTNKACSTLQSFFRNITFPLGIIDWISIFFPSRRRLGDHIASTEVVNL